MCASIVTDRAGASSDAPPRPDLEPIPPGERLGYSFDPVPKAIRHDPRLKPHDGDVAAILLEFRIWRRDSCWTTVRTVAARLRTIRPGRSGSPAACERTVQRSLGRLEAAGYLRHERVAKPDPDDSRNRTGWRFFLGFIPLEPRAAASPREVTKGPAAAPTPAPSPAGEVTKASGDSLVTQVRGETREQESESTLNVTALAGPGEAGSDAGRSLPGLTPCDTGVAPDGPDASGLAPPAVAPAAPAWSDAELAEKAVRRARAGGWDLRVVVDPDRGELIRPRRMTASAGEIPAGLVEHLKRLRPHVLAYLKGGPAAPAGCAAAAPAGRPAPKVPAAARAEVRSRIGRLRAPGTTRADAVATARALASALGPHRDEGRTVATLVKMCGQVRSGAGPMSEAILQDAFEAACRSRSAASRGALFTHLVGELLADRLRRGRPRRE